MLLQLLQSLRPTAKVFFDGGEAVFTQADIDRIKAETAKESFEVGRKKAGAEAIAEAEKTELEAFRKNKLDSEATQLLKGIETELTSEEVSKATTLNPDGTSRFVAENKDVLKGLKGAELIAKVNTLKELPENKLFFSSTDVKASQSLLGGDKPGEKTKVEYYKGSSLIKR